MAHEGHTSTGFGKNTNGLGLFIVAAVLVSFVLVAWGLWNKGAAEDNWYRFEHKEAAAHGEHGAAPEVAHTAAATDSTAHTHATDSTAHAADTTHAAH
ncbi:hypothetical protein [Phnomibacter ginsenosidimutans]|uniref:Uncharacterized protein n=1 Tax=Phnomibacter ginsenosidimutans TaxID=2676868 RepID=A0A6I6GM26_9BACT|nr:hypothetical protein [Phnomibacter ginsenosidimutans]QGW29545.1 hypothetical protein GLV81_16775 [Phnomibacter ginsenosidimutans]